MSHLSRQIPAAFIVAAACIALRPSFAAEPSQPVSIAVIDFEYEDTSGEPRDQTAEHGTRLKAFMSSMRSDLASSKNYRLVSVSCETACSNAEALDKAKRQGARLLVFGGIHKMSTLVQWGKVQVVDIQNDTLVFERLLTFRGDSDEAWGRAEAFIVKELNSKLTLK